MAFRTKWRRQTRRTANQGSRTGKTKQRTARPESARIGRAVSGPFHLQWTTCFPQTNNPIAVEKTSTMRLYLHLEEEKQEDASTGLNISGAMWRGGRGRRWWRSGSRGASREAAERAIAGPEARARGPSGAVSRSICQSAFLRQLCPHRPGTARNRPAFDAVSARRTPWFRPRGAGWPREGWGASG